MPPKEVAITSAQIHIESLTARWLKEREAVIQLRANNRQLRIELKALTADLDELTKRASDLADRYGDT